MQSSEILKAQPVSQKMAKRAAAASFFGSAVEYYDFFIYGIAAALVFNKIFFPDSDPIAGTLAALASFGVGYIARPVGAVVFGHLGDKLGRRPVLLLTLMLMGVATFTIGLLPTHASIGAWAPALLVLCRLLQGFSAGGEQVGATLLTMEHSPPKRRAFYTSWFSNGSATGSILASLVFIPISSLPEEDLMSWGWRIPFLLSAVMVIVTLLIRWGVEESPEFTVEAHKPAAKFPLYEVFRYQSRPLFIVFFCALVASVSSLVTVFGLSYAVNTFKVDRGEMLTAIAMSQFVALFFQPALAMAADRYGKKLVFVTGVLASMVMSFVYLWSISLGSIVLITVSVVLLKGVVYSAPNGVWPSFYSEMFPSHVRYSGMGIATQLSFLVMGFTPTISYAVLNPGAFGWIPVATFISLLCVASTVAALMSRPAPENFARGPH